MFYTWPRLQDEDPLDLHLLLNHGGFVATGIRKEGGGGGGGRAELIPLMGCMVKISSLCK